MTRYTNGGESSPLSSIPDSEGVSLPSLSQPHPEPEPEPEPEPDQKAAPQATQDVEITDAAPEPAIMSPSRPKRTRAAPSLKKEPPQPPKKVAKRTPKKKVWDAETILTDPKSPLANADLRTLLSNPVTWDVLSPSDKQEILALLPSTTPLITPSDPEELSKPDIAALRNDDTFRHDCTTFTENLGEGRFEKDWLENAWAAHERRKMGDFDDFLVTKFEETWETDLPVDLRPRRVGHVKQVVGEAAEAKEDAQQPTAASGHHDEGGTKTKAHSDGDKMVLDELQDEISQHQRQHTPLVQRTNNKMELDGEESADELA